ncbi:MAG: hypothetical protein RIQ56_312 [Candidatus Parcubacteria bacterium]|jgi:hypothetical protein
MSDTTSPEAFGHKAIEEDIERLSHVISVVKEEPEHQGASGEEIIKHSLRVYAPSTQHTPKPPAGPLPEYVRDASPEVRLEIERLVDLAFHVGIIKAVETAEAHSQFVFDAFHDALAGKLYPELQKRGIVH